MAWIHRNMNDDLIVGGMNMEHIINWNPRAHTVVRGSHEPYIISEIHQPEKVDRRLTDNISR